MKNNFLNIVIGSSMIRITKNLEKTNKFIGMIITPKHVKYLDAYILELSKFITEMINVEPDGSCDMSFHYTKNTSKKNKKQINALCRANVDNTIDYWRSILSYV